MIREAAVGIHANRKFPFHKAGRNQLGRLLFTAVLSFTLAGCSPYAFFYYPNRVLYLDPHDVGIHYEMEKVESLNGKKIVAVVFRTDQAPRGTVVHFHGNFGNVSNHFTQAYFLVKHGFDVVTFDYQGFGGSEGKPSPKNCIEDGIAMVRHARDHGRDPGQRVVVFGQSIGGAVAIAVAAKEPFVKAAVIESAFTRFRSIARYVTARSFLLWPLFPFYPFLLSSRHDPLRYVSRIAPRPILFIHGDKDRVIPLGMSKKLFEKAGEPKELWVVKGAGHLGCRNRAEEEYKKRVAEFLVKAL